MQATDPRFADLIDDDGLFDPKQVNSLFGRRFLKKIVREARDDRSLEQSLGKPGNSFRHNYRGKYRGSNRRYNSSSGFSFNKNSSENGKNQRNGNY